MAVPKYETIMLPLLKLAADGNERSLREAIEALAGEFNLSDDHRRELLPSGRQPVFDNRVGWARTYLKKAGLLESTRRGFFKVTDRGLKVLAEGLTTIDSKYLRRFTEFREFQGGGSKEPEEDNGHEPETPEEAFEAAYQELRAQLAGDLLDQVKSGTPAFFERLVVDLVLAMGYGGNRKDAGEAIGRTGDEGVDGIIKEDILGLDVIYLQAKKWAGAVPARDVREFAGALQGKRAKKGIFITTATFNSGAIDFASQLPDGKIVLIDGDKLAQLMIDYSIGVTPASETYQLKRIDSDYFGED